MATNKLLMPEQRTCSSTTQISRASSGPSTFFFFNDTASTEIYTLSLHDALPILNVDGMNIISNDGSNKLNRSRKARVSYKVQRTINASLNAATSTRAVSSNPNFVTRQKIEIIFG